jgi:hypothetical protein
VEDDLKIMEDDLKNGGRQQPVFWVPCTPISTHVTGRSRSRGATKNPNPKMLETASK